MFVLTNDDGVDAPGIRALLKAIQSLGQEAVIVAPLEHQSGCSHQVTTHQPIQVQRRSEWEYAIAGTPVDCVRIALSHLCPTATVVLSGINFGGNLGTDVYISGTVAAVREAALHRIPGIAISHYRQGKQAIDWERATHLTVSVLRQLLSIPETPGSFWNVNLPHGATATPEPDIIFCQPCTQPLPAVYRREGDYFHYAGEYGKRDRDPGKDVEVCFSGQIAVTQLYI